MKKLLVTLTVMGVLVGSLATISMAADKDYHYEEGPDVLHVHTGYDEYDVGRSYVIPDPGYRCNVTMYLKKNGKWSDGKTTKVPKNSSRSCYSVRIKGSGASAATSIIADYKA